MNFSKIGVVVADKEEYLSLLESVKEFSAVSYCYFDRKGIAFKIGEKEIICVYSGVGKVNAAAATMHLIDSSCDCILNFGLSGGISAAKCGGLCLPEKFVEHDFSLENIGYKPFEKPDQDYYIYEADNELLKVFKKVLGKTAGGTAVSGDGFICDEKVSLSLYNNVNAFSCDMETAAIAAVCRMANVPFCALRRISDDASDGAVETYREMNENDGTLLSDLFIRCIKELCLKTGE